MNNRKIKRIVKGYSTQDGAGVKLIRVLGPDDLNDIDPFLLMDAFNSDNPKDYIKGFPMHPHRGIETITYLLEGRIDHRDSIGNKGSLLSGELQWMTAGSGILHEEMPQPTPRLLGLQCWLNLAPKDKMAAPRYFSITTDMLKNIAIAGGKVKLISGEYNGEKGVKSNFEQVTLLDVMLEPGSELSIPVDKNLNTFIYLFEGSGDFGIDQVLVGRQSAAIFDKGDAVNVRAGKLGVHFILFAGKPLKEPVVWGGPIVMNTEEELEQAFIELRNITFVK